MEVVVGGVYKSTNTVADFLPCVNPNNRLVRVVALHDWGQNILAETETIEGVNLGLVHVDCIISND